MHAAKLIHNVIQKLNPAVDKKVLIALSGILWLATGLILCKVAAGWLLKAANNNVPVLSLSGVLLSLLIFYFGFLKLVYNNVERILSQKNKLCMFAFQPWKSYVIVAIMIAMGTALRHSPIPKPYLSVVYIGFGGAMFWSSIKYFLVLTKLIKMR